MVNAFSFLTVLKLEWTLIDAGVGCCLLLGGGSGVYSLFVDVTIVRGVLCLAIVLLRNILSSFAVISLRKRRADGFTIIIFLVSCGCYCTLPLSYGAVGW